jgi:endonuclease/exonuclease/phosphatase (EEP) superfamily protein YafD
MLTDLEIADGLPAILAGDMNSRPETDVVKTLQVRWTNPFAGDQASTPGGRPRFRGDYVLFRPADRWRVIDTSVVDDRRASDHRPVLVVLELLESR